MRLLPTPGWALVAALLWSSALAAAPLTVSVPPHHRALAEQLLTRLVREHPDIDARTRRTPRDRRIGAWWEASNGMVLLDRPLTARERRAFEQARGYAPAVLPLALDAALIIVNPDNPVEAIDTGELEALFGEPSRPGARRLRYWGDLGLVPPWDLVPISVVMREDSRALHILERRVLRGAAPRPGISRVQASERDTAVVATVERDRRALGLLSLGGAMADAVTIEVRAADGAAPVAFSEGSVQRGDYPLATCLYVAMDAPPRGFDPGGDSVLRSFIAFAYGESGTRIIESESYVPLGPEARDEARAWAERGLVRCTGDDCAQPPDAPITCPAEPAR